MKTKLFALILLAGGSMFAQTRFSVQIGGGGYAPGYYQPAPSYAVPQDNGYYSGAYQGGYQYAPQTYYAPTYGNQYVDRGYYREERREGWDRHERRERHEREERREREGYRDRR